MASYMAVGPISLYGRYTVACLGRNRGSRQRREQRRRFLISGDHHVMPTSPSPAPMPSPLPVSRKSTRCLVGTGSRNPVMRAYASWIGSALPAHRFGRRKPREDGTPFSGQVK
ncbi:uncharacterized protein LOC135676091 [Musa acuminata AAA Group]|uniref:uncharacterized protein LOC135676091 n=1 Tax=Musa acuminata AAA Group TaxID=214697 RepID=UPI0031D2D704